jgi:prepilin-type N-terminal cleavage/methylation domain-containing protein
MKRAFSLIEILLATAIFAIVASFFIFLMIESYKINDKARQLNTAVNLASEGIEAVRSVRDAGYDNLAVQSRTYCLAIQNNHWALIKKLDSRGRVIDCVESIGQFGRQITISSALSGRRIISTVSWPGTGGTKKIDLYSLVTDWR